MYKNQYNGERKEMAHLANISSVEVLWSLFFSQAVSWIKTQQ